MIANGLSFRYEQDLFDSGNSIVALLPVWAYECEVHPPYERELDAYEDAVLRMVRIGMNVNAMANALNSSHSLIGTVLSNLQAKGFVEKKANLQWNISNDAQAYFDGYFTEKASEKAEYGFMFASALRKDVLLYYHEGSLDNVKTLGGGTVLLRNRNEQDTFIPFVPDNRALGKAYLNYRKLVKIHNMVVDHKITQFEAEQIGEDQLEEDRFADLDSMDEIDVADKAVETDSGQTEVGGVKHGQNNERPMIVRRLEKPARRCCLRLRIIFDPKATYGFVVESPFDMKRNDNSWYLRQIQWMLYSEDIYFNDESVRTVLQRECSKLANSLQPNEMEFSFYVQEKMPLLKVYKERFGKIYENFENIYSDIQEQNSLLDKENIVNQICTKLLEALFRRIFQSVNDNTVSVVRTRALGEIDIYKPKKYRERLYEVCGLPADTLSKNSPDIVKNAAKNLNWSRGNSILEKMYNLMILYYYAPNDMVRKFVEQEDFLHYVEMVSDLNHIRISVAHDANHSFTDRSYTDFMNKVYPVANRMIRTIVGGN